MSYTIGVSIGIVPVTSQTGNINEVMKHADAACYTARQQGQNRSYVYKHSGNKPGHHHEEFHWASRISDALEQDRFKIYAQSIHPLDPSSNKHTHIEILVRMEDENGRLLPPASFIPAAERYKLMGAVDQHQLGTSEAEDPAAVHPAARADACIVLWMAGGMAAPETFDPKQYAPFEKGLEFKVTGAEIDLFPGNLRFTAGGGQWG